jgi:hypothetical protein
MSGCTHCHGFYWASLKFQIYDEVWSMKHRTVKFFKIFWNNNALKPENDVLFEESKSSTVL